MRCGDILAFQRYCSHIQKIRDIVWVWNTVSRILIRGSKIRFFAFETVLKTRKIQAKTELSQFLKSGVDWLSRGREKIWVDKKTPFLLSWKCQILLIVNIQNCCLQPFELIQIVENFCGDVISKFLINFAIYFFLFWFTVFKNTNVRTYVFLNVQKVLPEKCSSNNRYFWLIHANEKANFFINQMDRHNESNFLSLQYTWLMTFALLLLQT